MLCDKIGELLSPYLDQMTNEKETRMVEEHLSVCSRCRNELEQIKIVCDAMRKLPVPELPDSFARDLEARLLNEKLKYFGKRTIKTPKKSGWIAASVAGIALAVGIYASSFLPAGELIANLQNRLNNDNQSPTTVAIDDILKHSGVKLNNKKITSQPEKTTDIAQTDNAAPTEAKQPGVTPGKAPAKTGASSTNLPVVSQAKSCITEVVTSKITVNDVGSSLQQVIQIAAANGGEYTLLPSNKTVLGALTTNEVKIVSIKVDKTRVNQVLNDLNSLGKTGEPVHSNVELTEQYNNAVNNINSIQQQINTIKSQAKISTADQTRLDELQKQLNQWNSQKSQVETQLNQVTINVYLVGQ